MPVLYVRVSLAYQDDSKLHQIVLCPLEPHSPIPYKDAVSDTSRVLIVQEVHEEHKEGVGLVQHQHQGVARRREDAPCRQGELLCRCHHEDEGALFAEGRPHPATPPHSLPQICTLQEFTWPISLLAH